MNRKQTQIIIIILIIIVALALAFLLLNNPVQTQPSNIQASQKQILTAEGDPSVQSFIQQYNGSVGSVETINQSYFQTLQNEQPVIYGGLAVLSYPVYAITFNSSKTTSSVLVVVSDDQVLRVFPVIGIAK